VEGNKKQAHRYSVHASLPALVRGKEGMELVLSKKKPLLRRERTKMRGKGGGKGGQAKGNRSACRPAAQPRHQIRKKEERVEVGRDASIYVGM